jgi:2-oxoisovalerate dehydrogenase E1 component
MTVNFSLLALDQIMNTAATIRHMSGGQFGVPLVIRMATGAGKQLAAQHSHSLEGWYGHIPGLRVLAPATVEDARGMLQDRAAGPRSGADLRKRHALQHDRRSTNAGPVDIDRAAIRREGKDVSLITYGGSLWKTLEAAEALGARGHRGGSDRSAHLRPLDDATIMASVGPHPQGAVVVDEGWRSGSISAEIIARINEQAFWNSTRRWAGLQRKEVPIPYPKHLEAAGDPAGADIVAARREGRDKSADGRLRHAVARRRHGGRHAGRMAGQARRCGHRGDVIAVVEPRRAPSRSRSSRTVSSSRSRPSSAPLFPSAHPWP